MPHNIYVNIILSNDNKEFPNEYGLVSEIKKEIKLIMSKYPDYKMKRYNFDIVDDEFDTDMEFVEDT